MRAAPAPLRTRAEVVHRGLMNAIESAVVALERSLGESAVLTDRSVCETLSRDESDVPGVPAICVVEARRADDVRAVLEICDHHEVPVVPRGGGTGRTGGAVPLRPSVLLDTRALSSLHDLDRRDLLAVVGPGMITADLHRAAEREGLFFPPDPLSAPWCCLGGNVAENAGGPRAFKYGVTRDWTLGLDAVLMGGEQLSLGRRTTKGVAGYDLTATLVGSEGTLAVFTSLTLRLMVAPPVLRGLTASFRGARDAAVAVETIVAQGFRPRCIELIDALCCEVMREQEPGVVAPGVGAMLLMEFDGDGEAEVSAALDGVATICEGIVGGAARAANDAGALDAMWRARRVMSRALRRRALRKLSEDVVVPRSQVSALLDEVARISERFGVVMPTYGHAGDGNLHVNLLWNHDDELQRVEASVEALLHATLALRGTITGEHGVGVTKRPYLSWEQAEGLIALQRRVKRAFDPKGLLNPDKIFEGSSGHGAC